MTKERYLDSLRKRLGLGYRQCDVSDIVADYEEMFDRMLNEGLSNQEIIAKLGRVNEVVASLHEQKKPDYFVGVSKLIEWAIYLGLAILYLSNAGMFFGGSIVNYVIAITLPVSFWGIEDRSYARKEPPASQSKHTVLILILGLIALYLFLFIHFEPWKQVGAMYGILHAYVLYGAIILSLVGILYALRQASIKHYFTLPYVFLYNAFFVFFIAALELCTHIDTIETYYSSLFTILLPSLLPLSICFILQLKKVRAWIFR